MKRLLARETTPLVALLAILLLAGLFTFQRYGESWDEFNYLTHATYSLQAYTGPPPAWDEIYRFYGPSFMMLTVLVGRLFPGAILSDIAHLLSFFTFLAGLAIFYALARRWLGVWESYGALLLFASQPLLWGHAFINSKDTPFMVGFLASIYFGLRMMDTLKLEPPKQQDTRLNGILREEVQALTPPRRILLVAGLLLAVGLPAWLAALVADWQAAAFPPVYSTESFFELEQYLYQVTGQVNRLGLAVVFVLAGLVLAVWLGLPVTSRHIHETELRPLGRQLNYALSNGWLWLAAGLAGFTASIRFLGLAAIGFVGLWFLWKHRQAALVPLAALAGLSLLFMYFTWPYLWPAPIFRFLLTVAVMLRFPWAGKALFDGQYYAPKDLPWDYLPRLIGLQTTETALFLFFIGLAALVYWLLQKKPGLAEFAFLAGVWFFLPVLWAVIGNPNLYDNFRQLHFILPPMFLLGGLGLQALFVRLRFPVLRVVILLLLVLPGLAGWMRLFPYEYTYYNSLAGGETFRRYEADYWATSFREASQYISKTAEPNAQVVVWGPVFPLWAYLREDIMAVGADVGPIPSGAYYAVILSRNDNDLKIHPEAPQLYAIEKDGMTLAVVKYIE